MKTNFTKSFKEFYNNKFKKKDFKSYFEYYWICKGEGKETNCGKIFHNDDDNVCKYCGSKNTQRIAIESIRYTIN